MLFLAVFCGFLAEYALEHKIEGNRERQYALSMVEDLKLDTAALNRIIPLRTRRIDMLDSLSLLLNEAENSTKLSDLYFYSFATTRIAMVQHVSNDRTIQQLKNSGSLRLIRNKIVSDAIILYDRQVRRLENIKDREEENLRVLKPYTLKIFDGNIYDSILTRDDRTKRPTGNPALLQYTQGDLNGFIGALYYLKASNIAYRMFSIDLSNKAVSTMNTIKEEYHLK